MWAPKATRSGLDGQDIPPVADQWQPDRSRGIFETLLVVDGEPIELDAHLQRLHLSLEELYSQALPPQLEEKLRQAAAEIPLGRLRATLSPARDGLRLDLLAGGVEPEAVFPAQGVNLRPHPIAGGLGAHKWVDRKGINRPASGEAGALIVDEGEVLEAGWANVFAVRGGTLFTPPLDGRLLPGVSRARVIELARAQAIEVREQPLDLQQLDQADEVFLTNSIRGFETVESIEERALGAQGRLGALLRDQLRITWGVASAPALPASRS
jgi:para-aminobenzoate synthetase / 4-amino-4-deoxychorismate lyase